MGVGSSATVKAKSGLTSVRQEIQVVEIPPNLTAVLGAASYTMPAFMYAAGFASARVGVTNDTSGELEIISTYIVAGGNHIVQAGATTILDPGGSGLFIADLVVPITRRYYLAKFTPAATPPGIGASFEMGMYFLPND